MVLSDCACLPFLRRTHTRTAEQILADVAELKATLASTEQKKAELEGQALKTTDQLKRAEQLIGGLGDERERWQESADRLARDLKNLVGNVMLASGCLAYLGPFTRFLVLVFVCSPRFLSPSVRPQVVAFCGKTWAMLSPPLSRPPSFSPISSVP